MSCSASLRWGQKSVKLNELNSLVCLITEVKDVAKHHELATYDIEDEPEDARDCWHVLLERAA